MQTVIEYALKEKFKRIFAQCKSTNKNVIKINKKLGFKKVKEHVNEYGVKKILWVLR